MGYAVYEDVAARDFGVLRWAGYGVPAICDFPSCEAKIDRGMGYRCEEYTVWDEERFEDDDDYEGEQFEGCQMHFCVAHSDHSAHRDAVPKPDTREWEAWMLADESWAEWRGLNLDRVAAMQSRVTA